MESNGSSILNVLLLALMLATSFSYANNPQPLLLNSDTVILDHEVTVYKDPERNSNISVLLDNPHLFTKPTTAVPNYGQVSQNLWLRIAIKNTTKIDDWVMTINYSQLKGISVYSATPGLSPSGTQIYWPSKQAFYTTVPLVLPYQQETLLFIKIEQNKSPIIAPLTLSKASTHKHEALRTTIFWAALLSALVTMAAFNFANFLSARDEAILAYLAHILVFMISGLFINGRIAIFLPNTQSFSGLNYQHIAFLSIALTQSILNYAFLRRMAFSRLLAMLTKANISILIFCIAIFLLSSTELVALQYQLTMYLLPLNMLLLAVTVFLTMKHKLYERHYFSLSSFAFIVGATLSLLALNGKILFSFYTIHAFHVGMFIQVAILSLAFRRREHFAITNELEDVTKVLKSNYDYIEEQSATIDLSRRAAIKANKVKSQFLATMSHEFRTPLNAILGFANQLKMSVNHSETSEHVEIIHESANQMRIIVNDLLDYSQLESGDIQLVCTTFSASELLDDLISQMNREAENKQLELIFFQQPLPKRLTGDKDKIQQILHHLFRNAVKFTHTGYIFVEVTYTTSDSKQLQLKIRVEDSGIGIARPKQERLFKNVELLDDTFTRTHQGAGLGLYISNQLALLMNGNLTVSSQPQVGSVFSLTVPLAFSQANNFDVESTSLKNVALANFSGLYHTVATRLIESMGMNLVEITDVASNPIIVWNESIKKRLSLIDLRVISQNYDNAQVIINCSSQTYFKSANTTLPDNITLARKPLTARKLSQLLLPKTPQLNTALQPVDWSSLSLLAVDDMEMNLRLLETWLLPTNIQLTTCLTGQHAIDLCQDNDYDIILMDIQMPNMDGLTATQQIRRSGCNAGTPIIAVTAHAFEQEKQEFLQSGMDDHLAKPIDVNSLMSVINGWCDLDTVNANIEDIDWQLAISRVNGDEALAQSLFVEFKKELDTLLPLIKAAERDVNSTELTAHIHALHGISSQTGVPRIRVLCNEIEGLLKQGFYEQAYKLLPQLYTASQLALERDNLKS